MDAIKNKKVFVLIFFFCCITIGYAYGDVPVLFYSDITSGPNIGGQSDNGVFVTVWGENFGATQDEGIVTVGGGEVANYPEWTDTKVCFQLGDKAKTGSIVLTTSQGPSNPLPFIVRGGGVYFITPNGTGNGTYENPFSPNDFIERLSAGENGATGYFRAGVYDKQYAHQNWHANFCLASNVSGESGLENAFIAYPGETIQIRTSTSTGADRNNFRLHGDPACYIVVSKMDLYALNGSISGYTGWRIIGNKIDAIHELSGSGAISTGLYQDPTPHHIYIYGNEIAGGSSGNKLDHAIYPGSGVNYLYVGWNHIHDNNYGAGPMVSLNCNDAYSKNLVSKNIYFHDNIVDMTTFPARAFGVFETGAGSEVYYYNNVVICSSATTSNSAFYAMSSNVHYYNNTIYNGGGDALSANFNYYSSNIYGHDYAPESIEIKNNLVYANYASDYYIKVSGTAPTPIVENNLFYNIDSPRSDDKYLLDPNKVMADPLFINATAGNFGLGTESPAIAQGQKIAMVVTDQDGKLRPQNPSIGAFEVGVVLTLDAIPPTGSVVINSGAAETENTAVTLNLSASDSESGVSQMQLSNNNADWSSPESYTTSKSWTLSAGLGTKTVYIKYRDGAGNWSVVYSDTIELVDGTPAPDTTPPAAPTGLGVH